MAISGQSGQSGRKRRRIDPGVEQQIHECYRLGERDPRRVWALVNKNGVPSLKTVQRILREDMPDLGDPWSLDPDDPVPPALLEVLALLVQQSRGKRRSLTRREVRWLRAVHAAAPDLPPWTMFELAHEYMLAEDQEGGADGLDAILAFAPWRDTEHCEAFLKVVNEGWVKAPTLAVLRMIQLGGGSRLGPEAERFVESVPRPLSVEIADDLVAAYGGKPQTTVRRARR